MLHHQIITIPHAWHMGMLEKSVEVNQTIMNSLDIQKEQVTVML